ncbi:MAG TPA: carboxypeptidase regulatory-like domain-containing protein [Gemmatimonadaceae bacterium]|nr:carboxypeptidase regulatory-like domain-containing protein [Gemmatimonadaceae bacterium]
MRRMLTIGCGIAIAVPAGGFAQQASSNMATTVVASVADARTGAPLVGAEVMLPALKRRGSADWIGEVRIPNVPAGSQVVTVRAVGHASSTIILDVAGDSVGAVFMLEPSATNMDTVRIIAPSTPLYLQAFATRRRIGIGQYLTDSALAREPDRGLATVLVAHLHGLRITAEPDSPALLTVSGTGVSVDEHGGSTASIGVCPVEIYVDDHPWADHLESIPTRGVAGVELYDYDSAPPQYRVATPLSRPGSGRLPPCKVLLIWTRQY